MGGSSFEKRIAKIREENKEKTARVLGVRKHKDIPHKKSFDRNVTEGEGFESLSHAADTPKTER